MPLSPEERAWAEKKISEGASKDEVFGFLASRPRPTQSISNVMGPPDLSMGVPPKEVTSFASDWLAKGPMSAIAGRLKPLGEFTGKAGASYLTGRGAAALASRIPAPPMIKIPLVAGAGILGEALGQGGGEITRQAIEGEPIDFGRAGKEAGSVALMSGAMKGAGAAAAYFGGVFPQHIGEAMMQPENSLAKPTSENWYQLGADVVNDTGAQALIKTQGRQAMEGIMKTADASGRRINGLEMAATLRRAVSKSNLPTLKASDQRLLQMANDVEHEVRSISPSGFIKPSEFDAIFRKDFTQPKFDANNVPEWGPDFKGAHSKARDQIAEYFYKELGPEMGDAAAQAHNSMMIRENLEDELMPRTGNPKPGRVGQKMRATLSPTNIAGMDTTKALEAYDAENGTTFSSRLAQLHTQEAFKPIGHSETQQVAQMGMIGYKPRSFVSAMLVSTARKLLRGGGPTKGGAAVKSLVADLIGEAKARDKMEAPSP